MADSVEAPNTAPNAPPTVTPSDIFNAADADVVILSSDNFEFRLHKKNLEFLSGAFPPADTMTSPNEFVRLTEPGGTLEILFQFVYPQRFPSLCDLEIDRLFALAEAAEKYEVFALMNICEARLRVIMPKYPRRVLDFAVKHNHIILIKEVAPILVPYIPLSDLAEVLPPHLYKPWSLYRSQWLKEAITLITKSHPHNCYEKVDRDRVRWNAPSLAAPLTLHQSLLMAPFEHHTSKYWENLALQYDNKECCLSIIKAVKSHLQVRIVNALPALQFPADSN